MANIDIAKLSQMVKNRRGKKNLREIAAEIGDVSISTLSRIEQGKVPDLDTFLRICEWLGVPSTDFTSEASINEDDHKTKVLYHLRADRNLDAGIVESIAKMIEFAYDNSGKLINKKSDKGV
ncbi:MAG TPA: helix-turn-helix transcriptional regulator [Bacteroidales bacterium]|jgi:transcriptional regulator with XRE-family HTH domain|nr:helix-turn-helix transcriptional regulator [Bacteroidales bacterium]